MGSSSRASPATRTARTTAKLTAPSPWRRTPAQQILKKTILFPPNFCCLSVPIPQNPVKISKVQHSVMCIVQQLQQRDMTLMFSFLRFKCPCLKPKVDLRSQLHH